MGRRELVPLDMEGRQRFRDAFELRPEFRRDPEAAFAYEYASTYKLYPDEINALGLMIQRRAKEG